MARFTVTSSASSLTDDDPDLLTLRGALAAAAESPGADVIRFAAEVTEIRLHSVLTLSDPDPVTLKGDRDGDHLPDVTLSGQGAVQHLRVLEGARVAIEGVAFVEGRHATSAAGAASWSSISNAGELTLRDVRFEDNVAIAGDGGTGGTRGAPSAKGKSADGYNGAPGDTGYRGNSGGTGGDAATVWNAGALTLENAVFAQSNAATPGTGGRGGRGTTGGKGGEGGDSESFKINAGAGGPGGRGGPGGFQGQHGEAAYGVLNRGGEIAGFAVAGDEIRDIAQTPGLATAPGGAGGAGGAKGAWYASNGATGPGGSSYTSSRGDRHASGLLSIDGGTGEATSLDAWFTVSAGRKAEIREGQSYTFAIQRHSIDDGIYEATWAIAPSVLTPESDFKGPTSGTVNFSEAGGDIALVTVSLARDDTLEGPEQIALRLTSARTLETEAREVAVSSRPATVKVASELPTNRDDVIRGASGPDNLLLRRGDDSARGRGGDDVLKGQAGNDRLWGDAGDDRLSGDGGRDRIWGGPGDDVIEGGRGADRMWGGGGEDVFRLARGDGRDVILGFKDGQDLIEITRGASRWKQIDVESRGGDALVSFRNVALRLEGVEASDIGPEDFLL
ncbi:hypothetical protein [uncultured Albimonas sp.]|uniref:calcium-binding protein n=1 Tax=uncultured Albimonas sp. TaxID=1331701 RepID=UPI0030ECD1C7|tara:strand:- start:2227 stop:4080 length:1854 start_codon:yes stop_codon:yes gene_type:complete